MILFKQRSNTNRHKFGIDLTIRFESLSILLLFVLPLLVISTQNIMLNQNKALIGTSERPKEVTLDILTTSKSVKVT